MFILNLHDTPSSKEALSLPPRRHALRLSREKRT